MKKIISLLLIFALLFTCGCTAEQASEPVEQVEVIETTTEEAITTTTEASVEISGGAAVETDVTTELKVEEIAKPVTSNVSKEETPKKTDAEYLEGFRQAFIAGNYEFNTGELPQEQTDWFKESFEVIPYFTTYNWQMSILANQCAFIYYCIDDQYYIWTHYAEVPYTQQDIINMNQSALTAAKEIFAKVHSDELSDYDQAWAYVNYLYTLSIQWPTEDQSKFKADRRPEIMVYDTPYSVLINKKANCNGYAATFNLLMQLEGITNYGLHVRGHVVSYLLIDDQEYFCDWICHRGIKPLNELANYCELDNPPGDASVYNIEIIRSLL